ncbi:MAG TPA: hypothetical protein VM778_06470 [Gemmatimonadota bacterium]|nr:hypothetical protein [Gemmatimonadota bacterium]
MSAPRDIPVWVDLVARNPYRVLGLPGDSSWPDIQARADALRARSNPQNDSTAWDLPWFAPLPRSAADVERALVRLADPIQRIRDRLFWFHERVSEMAVHELLPANLRNALEGWSATSEPLARHDAAMVALLKGLALDPKVEDAATWRRLFSEWSSAIALEEYWMAVLKLELGGGFETPASLSDVREVRQSAERLVAAPLLEIARAAVLDENLATAARALAVLREALPADAFGHTCGDLASHVWGRFDADWATPTEKPTPAGSGPPASDFALETQNPSVWELGSHKDTGGGAREPEVIPTEDPPDPAIDAAGGLSAEPAPGEPDEPAAPPSKPVADPKRRAADDGRAAAPRRSVESSDPGTDDDGEAPKPAAAFPDPEKRDDEVPFGRSTRRARSRLRPLWIGGIAASAAVAVAIAALDPRGSSADLEEPPDPVTLTVLERRLEQSYGEVAEAMVDRYEVQQELDLVARAVDGYRILVEDYERRSSYRLPVDRDAWRRVARTHDRFVERRDSLRIESERLAVVQDSLEQVDQNLLAAYNLLVRPDSRSRDPSPR